VTGFWPWPSRASRRRGVQDRGDYKPFDYTKVILPFTVVRRFDCVLDATKPAVLAEKALREKAVLNAEPFLLKKAGQHKTFPVRRHHGCAHLRGCDGPCRPRAA
jgi:hypothetical protein